VTDNAGWPEIESEDDEGVIVEEPLPPPPQPARAAAATLITNQLFIDFKRRLPEIPIGIQTTPASEQARDMPTSATLKRPRQTFRQPRCPRPGRVDRRLCVAISRWFCLGQNVGEATLAMHLHSHNVEKHLHCLQSLTKCAATTAKRVTSSWIDECWSAMSRKRRCCVKRCHHPHRLEIQDIAISRRSQGFEAPGGRFMLSTAYGCLFAQSGVVLDPPSDSRPESGDSVPLELSGLV